MWFSARLLFESSVPDEAKGQPLCEENLKLIEADSEESARLKALAIGHNERSEYANSDGAIVQWRFVDVLEIQELCEDTLYDGIEVYSRLYWKA